MADDGIKRVEMIAPNTTGIVSVEESQVQRFLDQGWKKVSRGSRRADTGSVPVQRAQQ